MVQPAGLWAADLGAGPVAALALGMHLVPPAHRRSSAGGGSGETRWVAPHSCCSAHRQQAGQRRMPADRSSDTPVGCCRVALFVTNAEAAVAAYDAQTGEGLSAPKPSWVAPKNASAALDMALLDESGSPVALGSGASLAAPVHLPWAGNAEAPPAETPHLPPTPREPTHVRQLQLCDVLKLTSDLVLGCATAAHSYTVLPCSANDGQLRGPAVRRRPQQRQPAAAVGAAAAGVRAQLPGGQHGVDAARRGAVPGSRQRARVPREAPGPAAAVRGQRLAPQPGAERLCGFAWLRRRKCAACMRKGIVLLQCFTLCFSADQLKVHSLNGRHILLRAHCSVQVSD
jgi:hypothetical protein